MNLKTDEIAHFVQNAVVPYLIASAAKVECLTDWFGSRQCESHALF